MISGITGCWAAKISTYGTGTTTGRRHWKVWPKVPGIAKILSLTRAGVAPHKLRFIYVRARLGGLRSTDSVAHMVLGYYATPDSEPLILDNLSGSISPASRRSDLTPVFSFNAQGIYVSGSET